MWRLSVFWLLPPCRAARGSPNDASEVACCAVPQRSGVLRRAARVFPNDASKANLRTNPKDFRGFDSRIILILRGGILMSMGDFPES